MKKIVLLAAALLAASVPARADYVVKDGNGVLKSMKAGTLAGSVILPYQTPVDPTGIPFSAANPLAIQFGTGVLLPSFASPQHFICDSGCGGGGGGGLSVPFAGAIGANGTPVGFKDGSGNFQPLLGGTTNGQWVEIKASVPIAVTGTFFQATQPVSGTVTANLGTIAGVSTETTLAALSAKVPALGQALAGASVPVVLTAAQLTTLTPLSSVIVTQGTGTNLHIVCDSGCSGSGGTSSTFGAAFPAAGTAVGMTQGGNMVALSGTGGSLNVNITGGAGSGGTAIADKATFTFSTTQGTPANCVFQTTATSNALTTGQTGTVQCTAQRAGFINLRDASGTELGVAAAPLQVSLANTAANAIAIKVDGSAVTQPVSGTITANAGTNLNTSLLALEGGGNLASLVTNIGAPGSAVCANDTASCSTNQQMQRLAARLTTINSTLNTPFQVGGSIGNTTFAATQATASSLNATVVGTGTFAVQATIATATAWGINTLGSTTSGQSGQLALGAVTTAAPSYTTAQSNALSLTTAGDLRTVFSNASIAVTQATASSLNATVVGTGTFAVQATLAAETTKVIGTVRTLGNAGAIFDGATASAVPANALYVGMAQGGNLTGFTGTSGNLNVQCANCSGSGVSTVDAATFTASTSLFAGGGGFFQTTATNNALTTGQQGMFQVTANRALFTNLRNASGTEVGTASTPLQVSLANTGSNGTALSVSLAAETTKVIGTTRMTGNIGGVLDAIGQNVAAPANWLQAGCQFQTTPTTITAANGSPCQMDNAGNILVNVKSATGLAQGSTTSGQSGSLVMGAATTAAPSYTTAQTNPLSLDLNGSLRVNCTTGCSTSTAQQAPLNAGTATATNAGVIGGQFLTTQPTMTNTQQAAMLFSSRGEVLVSPGVSGFAVTISGNQAVNVAQINGVTPLMGNGVSGTGSQRVNIASDNTAFIVNPASATAPVSTMNSASAAAGVTAANAFVFDDVSPTAITENSFGYGRMSANRNQYHTIRDAAGNERGANVSAGNALLVDGSATTQPVNVSQFGGVSTATGQVAVSVAPVTATNTALVTALRPDSPGIITLGQATKANSAPMVIASDQLGTATPATSLPTVLSAGTGNTVTGAYCMAVKSGTMAAGLAANAPIASFRFGAAAIALIRKVTFTAENAGTGFAAGVATFDLFAARSFSASDTTGNAATITGNNGKLRTSYATTGISDFRAAATATLTAGTRTLDTTPLNSLTVPASTAASIALVNPNTTLFDGRASEVPVILAQNEGIVLQATVPATGTWSFTAQVCWDEMASF